MSGFHHTQRPLMPMAIAIGMTLAGLTAAHATQAGRQPAPDIHVENWYWGPGNTWSYKHTRRVFPTAEISRGAGPVTPLETAHQDIDDITFVNPKTGETMAVRDMYAATDTNAILVMKRGKIVAEKYFGDMRDTDTHLYMSVSKSVAGILAGILAADGRLDLDAQITAYVPEVKGSAYEGATVRHLIDMSVGMDFDEDYASKTSDLYRLDEAAGWVPRGPDAPRGLRGYLPSLTKRAGEHGEAYRYVSAHTDLFVWVVERATNRDFADLTSELLWSKLGAERDAYVLLDGYQSAYMDPGFNATLRDTGRFAQMVLQRGRYNGQQIVPEAWIEDIHSGGDQAAFKASPAYKGWSNAPGFADGAYRSYWYVADPDVGLIRAIGLAGQQIVIDPKTETVVVKFSSEAAPGQGKTGISYAAISAIIAALK